MPCPISYVPVQERSPEDIINDRRDEALSRLEQELVTGVATVSQDPLTGEVTIQGASGMPEGMSDICVLAAMQTRNTLEFQLAMSNAGMQDRDFVAMHGHSHSH